MHHFETRYLSKRHPLHRRYPLGGTSQALTTSPKALTTTRTTNLTVAISDRLYLETVGSMCIGDSYCVLDCCMRDRLIVLGGAFDHKYSTWLCHPSNILLVRLWESLHRASATYAKPTCTGDMNLRIPPSRLGCILWCFVSLVRRSSAMVVEVVFGLDA